MKLGNHHKAAMGYIRDHIAQELQLDRFSPFIGPDEDIATLKKEASQALSLHLLAVRALQGIDIVCGFTPDPGEYDALRNSASWAINTLGRDEADTIIDHHKMLDDVEGVAIIQVPGNL